MLPFRTVRKKVGHMLIERGVINEEQLNKALEEQKRKGGYLSQHLIAMGFASELDIATCISNQFNFAYLPLKNYSIPQEVLDLVPLKWVKIYTLLPVDRVCDVLSVVMADPLNEGVIQMLHQITNCDIEVFISTYSEINEAINRYYQEKLEDLKEAYLDASDLGKVRTANEFIQTKIYNGPERREYVRIYKELDISYYYHGKTFQSKTRNISYGGVCFISNVFIPLDSNLACKVYLNNNKENPIDVVMNILRVQMVDSYEETETPDFREQRYEVAGMFDFIVAEERELLVKFLKENVS